MDETGSAHIAYPFNPYKGGGFRYAFLERAVSRDSDGDGINDAVDPEPHTYSNSFSDQSRGGVTHGEILNRNGLVATIDDVNPGGVVIRVGGANGDYVLVNACGIHYAISPGASAVVTCGSAASKVLSGEIEGFLGGDVVVVVSNGAICEMVETGDGRIRVENLAESLGKVTVWVGGDPVEIEAGGVLLAEPATGVVDIEGNGAVDALTDGLLILRYLFGFRGDSLTSGVMGGDCARCDGDAIERYLGGFSGLFDIDANGVVDALTDGLLILRYLFGFRGDSLTAGAMASDCGRCDVAAIEARLAELASP